LSLDDAIKAAETNNRSILTAELERKKAVDEIYIARTRRLPISSFTAIGSQPLSETKSIALAPLYKRGWQISDHRFLLGTFG